MPIDRAAPDVWHQRKRQLLDDLRRTKGLAFMLGERQGSRVARGPSGTLYLPAARERQPGRWWLGLNERAFRAAEDVRGVVLLCEDAKHLLDFWLPAIQVRDLLPRLSPGPNDERKFNVVCRRDRYWLQVPGGEDIDITATRGNTSWLTSSAGSREDEAAQAPAAPPAPPEHAFFARVRRGRLEPLDTCPLEEGSVVIVRVEPVAAVPKRTALRQIVAAGGPTLPSDFAEQHDHYIRGTPRR